jgi:enamine deaminase RidA (YjgF/YER057c/UK114 family)
VIEVAINKPLPMSSPEDAAMPSECCTTDGQAPVLKLPATIYSQSSSDTAITYTVSATDRDPPSPTVQCTPRSGAVFTAGQITIVTCTARDAAGNTASGSFKVVVGEICSCS